MVSSGSSSSSHLRIGTVFFESFPQLTGKAPLRSTIGANRRVAFELFTSATLQKAHPSFDRAANDMHLHPPSQLHPIITTNHLVVQD